MKNKLALRRNQDKIRYEKYAQQALAYAQDPQNTDIQRQCAMDAYRRALRAIEISKLDPIAAYRVFSGIDL